jgi:serine/threonine protein kinase
MQMQAVDNIIQERRLLEEIQNNFIWYCLSDSSNLRYAFQDDENLFMVIDLMLGGDLRFHLDRMGSFTEEMTRLMIAETACGLAYLHSKNIVHRDLKPDNLLLDDGGHCHLTDFNIAVRFRPEKPLTAVAGSMAYMGTIRITKLLKSSTSVATLPPLIGGVLELLSTKLPMERYRHIKRSDHSVPRPTMDLLTLFFRRSSCFLQIATRLRLKL